MARKLTGISEPDFYDFLETAWSLSDSQLSRAISFLTDIQQRRATYGTCQAMADQRTKEKKCPKGHSHGITDWYLQRYLDLFWMVFNFAYKGLNTEKITHYLEKLVKSGTRTRRSDLWSKSRKSTESKEQCS